MRYAKVSLRDTVNIYTLGQVQAATHIRLEPENLFPVPIPSTQSQNRPFYI